MKCLTPEYSNLRTAFVTSALTLSHFLRLCFHSSLLCIWLTKSGLSEVGDTLLKIPNVVSGIDLLETRAAIKAAMIEVYSTGLRRTYSLVEVDRQDLMQ